MNGPEERDPSHSSSPRIDAGPFIRDLTAGLTVGALAIPSAMAYAGLIGVPPVFGLYVLLLPLIAYAPLGSSRQVIVGPEAGIAGMLGAALVGLGGGNPSRLVELASATALMVGACFVVARLLHLGWIADYFSRARMSRRPFDSSHSRHAS